MEKCCAEACLSTVSQQRLCGEEEEEGGGAGKGERTAAQKGRSEELGQPAPQQRDNRNSNTSVLTVITQKTIFRPESLPSPTFKHMLWWNGNIFKDAKVREISFLCALS